METTVNPDNWEHRSIDMVCDTCMYYINLRCRRNAPSVKGFPAVYPNDWCGDHKMDKQKMREIHKNKYGVILK